MSGDIEQHGDQGSTEESSTENDVLEEDTANEVSDDDVELNIEDDVGDGSTMEVNVEALVAKVDATDAEEIARQREVREKLEALNEQRDDKFGTTYNFNIDEDLS